MAPLSRQLSGLVLLHDHFGTDLDEQGKFGLFFHPILQSSKGLHISKPQDHDGKSFAKFLMGRSLRITPAHDGFSKLPYDLYCPSLQKDRKQLLKRTCQICGLYFCTKKKVKEHISTCHKQIINPILSSTEIRKICPSRILTKRSIGTSKEVLCVVNKHNNSEWLEEIDVDLQKSTLQLTCKTFVQLIVLKKVILIHGQRIVYNTYIM